MFPPLWRLCFLFWQPHLSRGFIACGERSRSPTREGLPGDSTVKAPEDKVENEGGKQPVPVEDQQVAAADDSKKPEEGEPKTVSPAVVPEENAGRTLLNAVLAASKSLERCATQLETNVALLETMRPDSATLSSLTCSWSEVPRQRQQGVTGKSNQQPTGHIVGLVVTQFGQGADGRCFAQHPLPCRKHHEGFV